MAQLHRSPIERRTYKRSDVMLPGLLRLAGEGRRAVLRNISRSGAQVEVEGSVPKGSRIDLNSGALSADGIIVWSDAETAGVKFNQPISDSDLIQQVMRSDALSSRRGASAARKTALKPKRL